MNIPTIPLLIISIAVLLMSVIVLVVEYIRQKEIIGLLLELIEIEEKTIKTLSKGLINISEELKGGLTMNNTGISNKKCKCCNNKTLHYFKTESHYHYRCSYCNVEYIEEVK